MNSFWVLDLPQPVNEWTRENKSIIIYPLIITNKLSVQPTKYILNVSMDGIRNLNHIACNFGELL